MIAFADPSTNPPRVSPDYTQDGATEMFRWLGAAARAQRGTGRARFLDIGDSTTDGSSGRLLSSSKVATDVLNSAGLPASYASSFGDGGTFNASSVGLQGKDPRWSFANGWASFGDAGFTTVGGFMPSSSTPGAKAVFTPAETCDQFDIYYVQASGTGTLRAYIDAETSGSGYAQVSTTGADALIILTLSMPTPAARKVTIEAPSGLLIFSGVIGRNTQKPAADLINGGWSSSRSTDWIRTTYPWSPINTIKKIAPDLTRINLGINDWDSAHQTPMATYAANIRAIADAALISGDVLVTLPFPSGPLISPIPVQSAFRRTLLQIAKEKRCRVLDLSRRFGSNLNALANGFSAGDGYHPSATGYADIGRGLALLLMGR